MQNACMNTWGMLTGDRGNFSSAGSTLRGMAIPEQTRRLSPTCTNHSEQRCCLVQLARFTDGGKRLMHQSWFGLHTFDPPQNFSRAMTAVLPLFMGHMPLEIVVLHPFF